MERTEPQREQVLAPRATWWSGLRARLRRVGQRLSPSRRAWRGAATAMLLVAALLWLWALVSRPLPSTPLLWLVAAADLLVAALAAGVLLLVLRGVARLPRPVLWALLAALVLLVTLGSGPSRRGWFLTIAIVLLCVATAGGVLWSLAGGSWRTSGWLRRLAGLTALLVSAGVLLGGGWWLLSPGAPAAQLPAAAQGGEVAPTQGDPSQPGPYKVRQLLYGSGADRRRPEYGAGVALTTDPVDASRILSGWQGPTGDARTAMWGFDAASLPLNGRVWYPEGGGPFPLVLIVHGNSSAVEYSEAGFAYLGELLASRGFVVASVDQNFLNTGLIDTLGGLGDANAARGWLLLEHLRVWHAWNEQPDNPFSGRIDTGNIALIGHSRGGEAAAIAAAFNGLDRYPDDAMLQFDYGYAIRSVVAIAPSDAQYRPAGEKIALNDISYLALQGSHDADVFSFAGLDQFQRAGFDADQTGFKAALYVYRANHSQWNSLWGRYDVGEGLAAHFIDTAALLPAEQQRKVAQVFVAAFLEATLRGQSEYRRVFRDPRYAGAWLPDGAYRSQYGDAATSYLSTYDEDLDPVSATLAGASQEASNVSEWHERHLPLKAGDGDGRAVQLGWQRAQGTDAARYVINLAPGTAAQSGALRFDLADAAPGAAGGDPISFSLELRDSGGNTARLPLSRVAALQPPIEGRYLKAGFLHDAPLSEPVLQTYHIPLADFEPAGAFDPSSLISVSFVFDETPAGAILLDNIGLSAEN